MPQTEPAAKMPIRAWAAPLATFLLLAAAFGGLLSTQDAAFVIPAALLLGLTVFAAVYHAETVAMQVGEPFGAIVLAVSVVSIEVAIVVSVMLSSPNGAPAIARDTIFAALMIVLNGVVGLCLVAGGIRHGDQAFQTQGASAKLGVLGTLATLALVLPNFGDKDSGPMLATRELVFLGIASLALYLLFLFVQTVRHRSDFLDVGERVVGEERPGRKAATIGGVLLLVSLVAVVLSAKSLTTAVESGVAAAGLPPSFVGVIIAALVLLPEGITALRVTKADRLQTSLNLSIGSAVATIGLTLPAITIVSLQGGHPVQLGLDGADTVLLLLTLFASTITLSTGRTTVLQGGVHLVIFFAFLVAAATN